MQDLATAEYLSAGGNRHSAASDWSHVHALLAYGADQNIALWDPLDESKKGVTALLSGHEAKVTSLTFAKVSNVMPLLISGSADGQIRAWRQVDGRRWANESSTKAHEGAVNCITSLNGTNIFATGGADAVVKLWSFAEGGLVCLHSLRPKPRLIPLSTCLGHLSESSDSKAFLVLGGTRNDIYVYAIDNVLEEPKVEHCATLSGHEGWIRSLALKQKPEGGYLLASTSADKYVRLWDFGSANEPHTVDSADKTDLLIQQGSLTAKTQKVGVGATSLDITFESLLLGHEDWVYSAAWSPAGSARQLLTASADGSLTIWEPDASSGIWVSVTRLGEISGQKGATTATGSAGGFWSALWSPQGNAVTCLGRTGSWRLWYFDEAQQYWVQRPAVSGHVSPVNGLSWSQDGAYLLSTSSDQTTRLHADWRRDAKRTWHEFARPQIHGYDLNCVSSISLSQFASGADEKLLRVFDEPKSTANLLQRLCNITSSQHDSLPETAAIPVLGLSNKAMDGPEAEDTTAGANGNDNAPPPIPIGEIDQLTEPPTEDILARHTLWPEREKLYGHGYEISESASNGRILATACKASSLDHAVIRLYDTATWAEIRPPLAAHTLTVTRLAWSPAPHSLLLSVGRDRQWAIFAFEESSSAWKLVQAMPKAHSRMILDATWGPGDEGRTPFFATAGRDKSIKIFARDESKEGQFVLAQTIVRSAPVTAIATTSVSTDHGRRVVLAVGEESGAISVHVLDESQGLKLLRSEKLSEAVCPSKAVHRLAWRPWHEERDNADESTSPGKCLAIAAADSSLRVLRVNIDSLARLENDE
jgi:elongator complex protein 2